MAKYHTIKFSREEGLYILRVDRYIAGTTEQLLLQIRAKVVEELLVESQQTLIVIGIPCLFYQVDRKGPFERYLRFHRQTAVLLAKCGVGLRV